MGSWKRTAKRVAILRELASMGLTKQEAAIATGVGSSAIHGLAKKYGVTFRLGKRGVPPVLRKRILRDFGKEGMTPEVMAERYGTTRNSVSSTISTLRNDGLLPRRSDLKKQKQVSPS